MNFARFVFLDERAREFYVDWERAAKDSVAILRSAAGRDPFDRGLSDLVGELSTRSEEFRGHWAAHNVRLHNRGGGVLLLGQAVLYRKHRRLVINVARGSNGKSGMVAA